ncbi:MAG TPA: PHB depolymerase family esterase, partial [Roseiflexaceae bacterium]|nr:PHB depolymerase family esterase [Roseiflexaceae bacterium]
RDAMALHDKVGAEWKSVTRLMYLLPLLLMLVPAKAWALGSSFPPGDHTVTLQHGGRERSAIVHVPRQAAERSALPVVLNFHGGGGHGANQKEYSLLDALAESENFLAVYPNGTGRLSGRLLTWNAGTCCAYSVINKIDDVGFVRALIERLADKFPIDRRRIYATGMSNGGMMAHRLAAEASDIVAAVAPVAGGMVLPMVKSARPVPVLHIHSVDDPRALYAGGLGPPFPLTKNQVFHPNIDAMIKRRAEHNSCAAEPLTADRRVDLNARGHSATKYVYPDCRDGASVVLWKLTGAGHVWPGGKQKVLERILGPSTDIIDANREMWEFFKRFTL